MAEMIADPGNDAPDAVANPVELATSSLRETFPQLTDDTRQNYTGLMVAPEDLVNVMTYLRDEQGFNYLSSVTGVDLIDDNKMEVVYHAYSTDKGGTAIVLKCQVDRENPNVPSVTPIYPGAEFQEREAYDLFGIIFENHPDLRRILMWDGFEGHPMRKDWKEAFFEEETKPFGSRWPGGDVLRAEEFNPYGKNVEYPEGWTPTGKEYDVETDMYDISSLDVSYTPMGDIKSDTVTVNIGPQHPSTHGVFRMVVDLDGETVTRLKPVMGYLHRNHEKIGERNSFLQNIPYTDRLDYLSSMSNNHGYVMAVEKLIGSNVPERAEWIRVLMSEMTRIANHLWALGFLLNDLGALQTPMLYFYVERELILDFFESVSGARMMCNYMRFNGLAYDLPHSIRAQETMSFLNEFAYDRMPKAIDEWETLTRGNEIVKARSVGIGVLSKEDAIAYSATGPVLRASGVQYDVRKAEPYSYYDKLDFDIPVRTNGDIFDRYLIRLDEMRESLKIIRQVLPYLDETKGAPILSGKPQYNVRVPNGGDSYARVESPKGELGFYIMSHPKAQNPDRYHIRAPSFINLTPMEKMSVGYKLADVVSVLGSIDIVLGEVDR